LNKKCIFEHYRDVLTITNLLINIISVMIFFLVTFSELIPIVLCYYYTHRCNVPLTSAILLYLTYKYYAKLKVFALDKHSSFFARVSTLKKNVFLLFAFPFNDETGEVLRRGRHSTLDLLEKTI
jgi:hypothetical protein